MAETPTQGAAPAMATGASAKKPNKTEAVGLALQSLGGAATRDEIRAFVKSNHGYDMTADQVSNFKIELAKKARKAKANGAPAAKKPAAQPKPASRKAAAVARQKPAPQEAPAVAQQKPAATAGGNGKPQTVALADVLSVKGLVDRVGADGLRELIAAFES